MPVSTEEVQTQARTSEHNAASLMKIGQIKAPYGIQGWVWIYSDTDPMTNVFDYSPWWIEVKGQWKQLHVKRWRTQAKGLVALLDGVDSRNLADLMVGVTLYAPKAVLPAAASDEYYWSDLIGLKVYGLSADTTQQVLFGVVSEMFETGANDVIVVSPTADSIDAAERMIPWHKSTLGAIDIAAGRMDVLWGADY